MPPAKEQRSDRATSSRRVKIALAIAAVIVLLPGVVVFLLYAHHGRASRVPAPANVAEISKLTTAAEQDLSSTGDLNEALASYQQIVAGHPQDFRVFDNLGVVYARLGQYGKAAEAAHQAMKLGPDELAPYEHLAYYDMALQHPEDGHQVIRDAQAKRMDSAAFHKILYALAFLAPLGSDRPGMADQLRWFARRPQYESFGLALASSTAGYAGDTTRLTDFSQRAIDSATEAGNKEAAAAWQENSALRAAAFGNLDDARRQAAAGLKLAPDDPDVEVIAALAFAMAGDNARAEALAKEVEQQLPRATQMQSVWLPTIRAQIALQKKNSREAVNDLAPAAPLELGETGFGPNPTCMYSTYVRGQAYLADQKGTAAATEFQKILDHNGVVWNCWTGALAHVGLARANMLQAEDAQGEDADDARVRAVLAYRDFLKLWKDADPEIPILKQVKDELAQIQQ